MTKREKAMEYFKSGYNCSQSVVAAFCEDFGLDTKTALMVSEGFGGGMGRMRSVCGAVTGMFMLAGLKMSEGTAGDLDTRMKIYETVRLMSNEFEQRLGSTVCADLLAGNIPSDKSARPEGRTDEYYKKRPCPEIVGIAAEIAEKYLTEEK
ncbi:MAG: C-GCAxxG-C-C family protein [Clostridia bacterium]|nr:C-GCAxxG-C-C family protein [Clostridia bacterium]